MDPFEFSKLSKWTDDIKKDHKFYSAGTATNQTFLAEKGLRFGHECEDRAFSYVLKENAEPIYAYGLLDGYNGTWAVNLVEQCILANVYFDQLTTLTSRTNDEVNCILKMQFERTEQTLQESLQELLAKRAQFSVTYGELKRHSPEYKTVEKELKNIDSQIRSGTFAVVALLIEDRLFVASVGTCRCFIVVQDATTHQIKEVQLTSEHSLRNPDEAKRLRQLQAIVESPFGDDVSEMMVLSQSTSAAGTANGNDDGHFITYTRCLGDFKHKLYYHEYEQFRSCVGPPLIATATYLKEPLVLDSSYLFLVMCSEALTRALEMTGVERAAVNVTITRMLMAKIQSEQTLNSATQSVVDDIKRAFDDKFATQDNVREDFTLVVRLFDEFARTKERLLDERPTSEDLAHLQHHANAAMSSYDDSVVDSVDETNLSSLNLTSPDATLDLIDENNCVRPYVSFDEYTTCCLSNESDKKIFDDFTAQLEALDKPALARQSIPEDDDEHAHASDDRVIRI